MPARVRFQRRFLEDFRRQEEWLAAHGEIQWLENFRSALGEVRELVARFPESGSTARVDERVVLREVRFPRRLPYVAQYVHSPQRPVREVTFIRLFHLSQAREEPDLSEWPW